MFRRYSQAEDIRRVGVIGRVQHENVVRIDILAVQTRHSWKQ